MTQTQFVDFHGRGFWAYDVALGVFLKHLIDVAETRHVDGAWLAEAISQWRLVATVSDFGLTINPSWSREQVELFVALAAEACARLSERESIPGEEVASWPILDGHGVFPRGEIEVRTAPVVELGLAMVALAKGELPPAPPGTAWLYGTPAGRRTLAMRAL